MRPTRAGFGFLLLPLFLPCRGLRAYTYDIAPAPALSPAPPGPGAARLRVYVAPFRDLRRGDRDLWKGNTNFERVAVDAVGLDAQPKSWNRDAYGSASFLWLRQLGQALAARGITVTEAPEPLDDEAAVDAARQSGAAALLGGEILGMAMEKRGSDGLFGTDFSGTDYTFTLRLHVEGAAVASAGKAPGREWDFSHVFHDSTRLGRRDGVTFPFYFAQGLSLAAAALGDDAGLRASLGLPPLSRGAFVPSGPGSPGPGYWANPKNGKRMDPSWNFDPSDGTPRKDFVWRETAASPESPAAVVSGASITPAGRTLP